MNIKHKLINYINLVRLDKPYAIMLLTIPCFLSLALSALVLKISNWKLLKYYILFFVASIVMRSFGCIVNDIFDKDLDKHVQRTKNRPLANGSVSLLEAFILLSILGCIGIYLLSFFNILSILVALSSLILIIVYPLSKRFFYIPQLFLGLAFNWGALVVYVLLFNNIHLSIIILFSALIFWTLAYDTIYAYQDYEDDKKLKVYSLTLLLNNNYKSSITIFYIIMYLLLFILGALIKLKLVFYISISLGLIYILFKLYKLNKDNTLACFNFFKSNIYYGLLIWLGLVLS